MLSICVVVGNPKANSRTRQVAETLVAALFGEGHDVQVVELTDHAGTIFNWGDEALGKLTEQVAASDVAVFATPTYKAAYTGLLKAFLDRYQAGGLDGVIAVPVFTGADKTHSMGPDVTLVPLLLELGAVVPGRGLYFLAGEIDRVKEIVAEHAATYAANIRRIAATEGALVTTSTPRVPSV
jgi:FMN reductase